MFENDWNEKQVVHALLDWDMFKLVFCTWAYGSAEATVGVQMLDNDTAEIKLCLFGRQKRLAEHCASLLIATLSVLDGTAHSPEFVTVPCKVRVETYQEAPAVIESEPPSPTSSLPEGLVIAVLDDNQLVRKNVARICRSDLKGDELKFLAIGDVVEDCERFINDIIAFQVDIALFDENLDYDEVHRSGTTLAQEARRRGFKGCALLHSAAAPGKDLDSAFDGHVEKTADRGQFCENIARAYHRHLAQSDTSSVADASTVSTY